MKISELQLIRLAQDWIDLIKIAQSEGRYVNISMSENEDYLDFNVSIEKKANSQLRFSETIAEPDYFIKRNGL